jgi:hypothetical protein
MRRLARFLFAVAALLSLPPLLFFLLLLAEHHPLLMAWRDDVCSWCVPYWDMEAPPEIFANGWPITGKLCCRRLGYGGGYDDDVVAERS